MPTFSSLLGYKPSGDPQWDGVDIWPMISGQTDRAPDRPIYWNLTHHRFGLRVGDWKLIYRQRKDREETELFNIEEDPLEQRDLTSQHPEIVGELRDLIDAQHKMDDGSKRADVD